MDKTGRDHGEPRHPGFDDRQNLIGIEYVHIPVENEHLFRFKMNADSGLRVHRFRTPQCTYSDVR